MVDHVMTVVLPTSGPWAVTQLAALSNAPPSTMINRYHQPEMNHYAHQEAHEASGGCIGHQYTGLSHWQTHKQLTISNNENGW